MNAAAAVLARMVKRPHAQAAVAPSAVVLRPAGAAEAPAIHALILQHLQEGHLLPRDLAEITAHAGRFLIAVHEERVVACAELAPLSRSVAEIRSLVVSRHARGLHLGRRLVDDLLQRAEAAGFHKLCAFTHSPAYFVHMGFSIVPHVWLPEKIETDCHACPQFRQCGQYAVMYTLTRTRDGCVPLAALHG